MVEGTRPAVTHAPLPEGPSVAIRVMQWPVRTCTSCGHDDCARRRREFKLACVFCESRIRIGQRYRVMSRIDGETVTQIHESCERRMVER